VSLTNEDRVWFVEQLAVRIGPLETGIGQLETGIGQLDTKIGQLDTKIGHKIGQLEAKIAQLETRLDRVETDLAEKIERVETTLLTEFHKWASPMDMRQKSHSAALRALDLELESVDDRVKKLESDRPSQ